MTFQLVNGTLSSGHLATTVEVDLMNERVCSACGGVVKKVVLIEDHGPTGGEQPAAIAPGQAHRSLGVVYNEHYPTDATACTVCGHIDLWVDPEWVDSLK
jgi:hypothetical protein